MKTRKLLDGRVGSLAAAFAVLFSVAAPAALTATVHADPLTSRSIELSSSAVSATDVSYTVNFTPISSADHVIIEFCNDSPIPGQTCTAPTGFNASSADTTDGGTVTYTGNNVIRYAKSGMSSAQSIEFTDIDNPTVVTSSSVGFYARLLTYTAANYSSYTNPTSIGTTTDTGGVAMAITNPIQISAAVRETMTFCVSRLAPGPNCGQTGQAVTSPLLSLGHGTPAALDSSATDTGDVYTQISTNAVSGAIVNMKINNDCGGLKRTGAAVCDIPPVETGSSAIAAGTARFGMRVGDEATASGGTGSGTVTPETNYGVSGQYGLNFDTNDATGVTSPYGDPIYDTDGAPIMNQNVPLTFAATASSTTPAGLYSANMNLIATGTF